jgi:hypothetical protein
VWPAVGAAALALASAEEGRGSRGEEEYYEQIGRVVIRLEHAESGPPRGTAFFTQHVRDDRYYYLITARHIVEPRVPLRARVPTQGPGDLPEPGLAAGRCAATLPPRTRR